MKAGDVHGMTADQLNDELVKLKKEQFNLRFQAASGQLENTARVRQIRRDIARIQTVARQKSAKIGKFRDWICDEAAKAIAEATKLLGHTSVAAGAASV